MSYVVGKAVIRRGDCYRTTGMDGTRCELIVETTPDAVLVADAEAEAIVAAIPAGAEMVGQERGSVVEAHFSELHPNEESERYEALLEELVEREEVVRDGLHGTVPPPSR